MCQVVGRNTDHAFSHCEVRRPHRGHRHVHVGRINNRRGSHRCFSAGDQRTDGVVALILAHRKILHPPARQEVLLHDLIEGGDDLGARSQLVQASVEADRVLATRSEFARVNPIERRRLVQAYMRVRGIPVSTGSTSSANYCHSCVGFGQERIDKGHAHCAGTDYQVIHRHVVRHRVSTSLPLRFQLINLCCAVSTCVIDPRTTDISFRRVTLRC